MGQRLTGGFEGRSEDNEGADGMVTVGHRM